MEKMIHFEDSYSYIFWKVIFVVSGESLVAAMGGGGGGASYEDPLWYSLWLMTGATPYNLFAASIKQTLFKATAQSWHLHFNKVLNFIQVIICTQAERYGGYYIDPNNKSDDFIWIWFLPDSSVSN